METADESTETPKSYNEILREKFHSKLTELLTAKQSETDQLQANTSALNNIWCLNQIIIPLYSATNTNYHCGNLKLKYGQPESDFSGYSKIPDNKPNSSMSAHVLKELKADGETEGMSANFSVGIENTTVSEDESKDSGKATWVKKHHICALFATNHLGQPKVPAIIYPRNEFPSSESKTAPIFQTAVLEDASNGDLNDLAIFFKWLKSCFKPVSGSDKQPTIVLITSYLYKFLFKSWNNITIMNVVKKEIAEYCTENNIYLLFYPVESLDDMFNRCIYTSFRDTWNKVCMQYAMKDNPHTLLAFLQIFKQVVRKITTYQSLSEPTSIPLRGCFMELFKNYSIPNCEQFSTKENLEVCLNQLLQAAVTAGTVKLSSSVLNYYGAGGNGENGENVEKQNKTNRKKQQNQVGTDSDTGDFNTKTRQSNATSESNDEANEESYAGGSAFPKPTETELVEIIDWINEMSKVGCLCIKYTYLRELYIRYRSVKGTSNVEKCAHEKRWLEVVAKNSGRVNQRACGLNENDYLLRWYDEDYWRMEYYNFIRQQEQALAGFGADNIWTFDVIQFPYNTSTHLLRAPEKDYERRPRNSKPRVSVIFAFNAAGDYIQPYFIYPLNFKTENNNNSDPTDSQSDDAVPAPTATSTKEEPTSESQGNECFAPNGFVTCRVFEEWLTKSYFPYLKQLHVDKKKNSGETAQATNVLVFCGKLAVIDAANMKLCRDERVSLFNMTHENQMPFILLFQKSLRNRQTDLFLDSWRKITTKLNLGYQMKCKLRQDFFNLFTDTFQNCIEEIGNRDEVKVAPQQTTEMDVVPSALNQSFSSQSVVEFKNKMVSSFQQCLLWPLNEEEYANHLTKGQAILDKCKSINMADNVIPEETEIEVDDNLLKDSTNLKKEGGGAKAASGKRGRKSVSISETSENINSMKVQVNASDCETTEDLTADDEDETMGDDTLDSNLDELEGEALEESQSSEDEDFMASKSKRQRKSTKANKKTKVTTTTPLERKESRKAGKTQIKELETSIKKVLNGQIKDFSTASAVINDLASQNKEISLTDLVNDLLNVILIKEAKPNTLESNSDQKKRANTSWLNDPFEQRINSKIETFAASASTSRLFLESLFNDISNDICCLSATDKKTMYMKDLSSSICSFYLNMSHEKLKV